MALAPGEAQVEAIARAAAALGRRARRRKPGWPTLWLFTDPDRTPDVLGSAARLPPGSGVVFRTFGREDVQAQARALATLARSRRLTLLVGADVALAARIGAGGVHLPERAVAALPRLRSRYPGWWFTVAAHSPGALQRARRAGADAAFLSPAFPSDSPSAGRALGPLQVSVLTQGARLPVYALGGVDAQTARRLAGSGVAGVAGVSFSARR